MAEVPDMYKPVIIFYSSLVKVLADWHNTV